MRQTIKAGLKRKTPRKPGVWPIPLTARPVKRTAKKRSPVEIEAASAGAVALAPTPRFAPKSVVANAARSAGPRPRFGAVAALAVLLAATVGVTASLLA